MVNTSALRTLDSLANSIILKNYCPDVASAFKTLPMYLIFLI